jgi:hypothetical protein
VTPLSADRLRLRYRSGVASTFAVPVCGLNLHAQLVPAWQFLTSIAGFRSCFLTNSAHVPVKHTTRHLSQSEPLIVPLGPAQIEFPGTVLFSHLNGLPEQHRHGSQTVKSRVGAAVFVDQCILSTAA